VLSERAMYALEMVPFATSIVLVMGMPEAAPAQPRALVGGHLISTLVGLIVLALNGGASPVAAAIAVGIAIATMRATRTLHPPAGIDPLVVVLNETPWSFLLAPVAVGVLLLAGFAFLWHNLFRRGTWPRQWW
jgi:CBS-domain-containing membrane protein